MNHLALEVGEIDHVEVDNADFSDAGGRQVQAERRSEPSGSDQKNLRVLELDLPFHADLRHDQVARVAQDFVFRKRGHRNFLGHDRAAGDAGNDRKRVGRGNRRLIFLEITNVFIVQVDVDEAP